MVLKINKIEKVFSKKTSVPWINKKEVLGHKAAIYYSVTLVYCINWSLETEVAIERQYR